MLQVIVHRRDDFTAGGADAAEQRVMLAEVPHQVDAAHPGVFRGQALDGRPALVAAAVVDQDEFVFARQRRQHRLQPLDQQRQDGLAVVNRHDDRKRGNLAGFEGGRHFSSLNRNNPAVLNGSTGEPPRGRSADFRF